MLIQLTGLSGAGKSTIATNVAKKLQLLGISSEIIDGDYYRKTISKDLGFSKEERCENVRRLGKIANDITKRRDVVIMAVINPYEETRKKIKSLYDAKTVYIDCDLATLIQRDTKDLYRKAMLPSDHPEKIPNLTGVNDIYEAPKNPDLVLETDKETLEQSVKRLYKYIISQIE